MRWMNYRWRWRKCKFLKLRFKVHYTHRNEYVLFVSPLVNFSCSPMTHTFDMFMRLARKSGQFQIHIDVEAWPQIVFSTKSNNNKWDIENYYCGVWRKELSHTQTGFSLAVRSSRSCVNTTMIRTLASLWQSQRRRPLGQMPSPFRLESRTRIWNP